MMVNKIVKNKPFNALSWTLIIAFGSFAILLMLSPDREVIPSSSLPWNARVSQDMKTLMVLGLEIPTSTLKDAMDIYGDDIEIRIFSNKDESNKNLEAYFPTAYVGSIQAALLLKLKADEATVNKYYDNGVETTISATGKRKVKLLGTDISKIFEHHIDAITLIPKRNLSPETIKKLFAEPSATSIDKDTQIERWSYPKIGLEILYDAKGPEALQYSMVFVR